MMREILLMFRVGGMVVGESGPDFFASLSCGINWAFRVLTPTVLSRWIVFLVVGFLTGILAGMIQIAREWAFDLKFGYCETG